jgi:plastocyanin
MRRNDKVYNKRNKDGARTKPAASISVRITLLHTFFVALLDERLYRYIVDIPSQPPPPDLFSVGASKKKPISSSKSSPQTPRIMRSHLLPLATLALLAHADDSSTSTSTSTSTGVPATYTHEVKVGSNGLKFEPDTLTASPGDLINFHFYAANHSVAQSSFDKPCQPLDGGNGIFSGFFAASGKDEANQVFSMRLNGSEPVWLYCAQGEHCKGGQAMVINAP